MCHTVINFRFVLLVRIDTVLCSNAHLPDVVVVVLIHSRLAFQFQNALVPHGGGAGQLGWRWSQRKVKRSRPMCRFAGSTIYFPSPPLADHRKIVVREPIMVL